MGHRSTAAVKPAPALRRWDVEAIAGLQSALKSLGYRNTADGDCGPETHQAVTSFQTHAGIVAGAIRGLLTEAELRRELAAL